MDNTVSHEPVDLLTRLAGVGAQAIEDDPDFDDSMKIIVCVDTDARGGLAMINYEDGWTDAVATLFSQMRAIVRAHGKDLAIIGIPDDPSGVELT